MFSTLIVDDSAEFRRSLSDLLHARFPETSVAEARNGGEAWKQLIEHQPGLVFIDIKLRNEDGLQLTSRIRRSYPDVVVAVFTAYDTPEYREAAYHNGADCFVPKGMVTVSDIVCLIESVATRQRPQWALGACYLNPTPPTRRWD